MSTGLNSYTLRRDSSLHCIIPSNSAIWLYNDSSKLTWWRYRLTLCNIPRTLCNTYGILRNRLRTLRNPNGILRNTPGTLRNTCRTLRNTFGILRNTPRTLPNTFIDPVLAGHDSDSLYTVWNHVSEPSDLDLWPMTLIFGVDLGIIMVHPCTKFHQPKFIGLDFRPLNTFCVRALEKK